jgi:uncharacterized membrane protein
MLNRLAIAFVLVLSLLFLIQNGYAATHRRTAAAQARHKRHVRTAKRVGVGTAGGAAIGTLAGHGKGAAVGAAAGAGAGALYDHEKNKRH